MLNYHLQFIKSFEEVYCKQSEDYYSYQPGTVNQGFYTGVMNINNVYPTFSCC